MPTHLANGKPDCAIHYGREFRANAQRNTLAMPHINNWDFTVLKRINITERPSFEFSVQATNLFNHAQYIPGYISDVAPLGTLAATFWLR